MFINNKVLKDFALCPDEYFVLYHIYAESVDSMKGIFTFQKRLDILQELETKGYIKITESGPVLRQTGISIFTDEDPSLHAFVVKYRKLFKDTGKAGVQGDRRGCINKMERFFKFYPEFDEETILKATDLYISKERMNSNYNYLQKAHYFIFKQDNHKNEVSNLAAFCESVLDGANSEDNSIIQQL